MRGRAALATAAWLASGWPDARRFQAALRDPRRAQARALEAILAQSEGTAFAAAHGLPGRFQELEPRTWDGFDPWIDRIAAGERGVLTRQPVERFEPSSGSTRAAKLVPTTALSRRQFNRAIHPWVVDLYRRRPGLLAGPAYWSISPGVDRPPTPGGIPVGFAEDSEYLGRVGRLLVDASLAVPGEVRRASDPAQFQRETLLFLLAQPELRLISIWNPTFLTALMGAMDAGWDALAGSLHDGVEVRGRRLARRGIDRARPWPRLGLISCWTDAHAATQLDPLRARFPGVEIQPKGLLATEGVVSIPWGDQRVLAVTSHYLEFEADDGALLPAHALEPGQEVGVVLTTGAGLYRYRLQDRIQVTGFVERTPAVRFLGRGDRVSDRVGEKLSEAFVGAVLRALCPEGFSMLAPDGDGYTLYATAPPAAEALEARLGENPHYRWAVSIQQLRPARIFQLTGDPAPRVLEVMRSRGIRLGDIKPAPLDLQSGWSAILEGDYR